MTEVTASSTSSDIAKSDESSRKPGKLGGMVSLFEKKAEEKQQPPLQTRSASNSLSTSSSPSPITPLQHSASTSATTSPAPRVGASIADRMAAMKNLTMSAPAPSVSSAHGLPGKLSANAKTLPLSFEPPAASTSSSPSTSSTPAAGGALPRPNKLAMGGLGALNAALANGLKAGFAPGGVRTPSTSVTKRDDSNNKPFTDGKADDQKEEALLQTAPAAISISSDDSAADGASAELTHAKKAKRAGRSKAVSRPAAGTLRFKAFSDVSKTADVKAAVTIIGGEEKKEQTEEAKTDDSVKGEQAAEVKEQPQQQDTIIERSVATDTSFSSPAAATASSETNTANLTTPEAEKPVLAHSSTGTAPTTETTTAEMATSDTTEKTASALAAVVPTTAVDSALNTSSASIDSEDSVNSSFSSVTYYSSAAPLDSSFTGEQLSVYNAAADYFQDPATLGYNPAMHARYSTLLHTGATFHRWQLAGSSAKRLLYLSDCTTYLCLVDSKKRLALDKVEPKRRLPVALLSEVVKGKAGGDEVWARSAVKEVLAGRCLVLRCGGGDVGEGMLGVMHVEALTGVQRDEWEEALRWLIATKGKESSCTDK